jgi:acetoin utilization deacetylase AcuC-like enzyme
MLRFRAMGLIRFLLGRRYPFHFVYSDEYWMVDLGKHVFPVRKYRMIYEKLLASGARPENFIESGPAEDDDLLLVHTPKYIKKLKIGALSDAEVQTLELPFSEDLARFGWLHVGGTIRAAKAALTDGLCVHIGGGFHHAFADHGEGFCVLNDVAVAIETLRRDGAIRTAMVVDCDLHQGNGTAAIFAGKEHVFTFSIHQMDVYPAEKETSSLDVGLWTGDGDARYLALLRAHIPSLYRKIRPDIVFYVAGADPLAGDKLGGLELTHEGLFARDEIVLEGARGMGLPVVVVLAGGYAPDVEDGVSVHMNTIKAAARAQRRAPGRPSSPVRPRTRRPTGRTQS